MTDINTYRSRIVTFQQPGQRKFKMNTFTGKMKNDFFSGFLRILLICSTFSLFALIFSEHKFGTICQSEGFSHQSNENQSSHYHEKKENISLSYNSSDLSEENNFYARYTYGNRKNRGIKVSHWNAGSAHLPN